MKFTIIATLMTLGLVACTSAPAGSADTAEVKESKLCRKVEVTGSIMPKRDCRTVEQWAKVDGEAEGRARNISVFGNDNQDPTMVNHQ